MKHTSRRMSVSLSEMCTSHRVSTGQLAEVSISPSLVEPDKASVSPSLGNNSDEVSVSPSLSDKSSICQYQGQSEVRSNNVSVVQNNTECFCGYFDDE